MIFAYSLLLALQLAAGPAIPRREMVVTFDDLPTVSVLPTGIGEREALTRRLLEAITRRRIPAIGFVNEAKLADSAGHVDPREVSLLRQWLIADLELGNHTRSHPDLHRTPLATYLREIVDGEQVTRRLLAERNRRPRYFRHPFLHTGRSVAVRDSVTAFLARHGYQVAPVTVDNADYLFAAAYDRTRAAGDTATARRVAETYLEYMDSVVTFYEEQAIAILDRDFPQILLLHANALNADTFGALADRLEARGYRFVSLEQALADSAYRLPDRYDGPAGITWLHRWAMTRGMPGSTFRGEPEVPDWVSRAAARPGN